MWVSFCCGFDIGLVCVVIIEVSLVGLVGIILGVFYFIEFVIFVCCLLVGYGGIVFIFGFDYW